MDNYDEDYELICQSTDDDKIDMRENVLVSENKNIIGNSNLNYNFNDFLNSIFFQILVVIIAIYLIYYLWKFSINLISNKRISNKRISTIIKGGKK